MTNKSEQTTTPYLDHKVVESIDEGGEPTISMDVFLEERRTGGREIPGQSSEYNVLPQDEYAGDYDFGAGGKISTETTTATLTTHFSSTNTTELQRDWEASDQLTSRERTILLGTLIPAITIILFLLIALIYVLHKQHKRQFSRVGSTIENKACVESGIRSSLQTNEHAHRPPSRDSAASRNGTTNGVLRAWEDNEMSHRQDPRSP